MHDTGHYDSPLGKIFLTADEIGLTGLWFEGQKPQQPKEEAKNPAITTAKRWLGVYFSGQKPDFTPPLHLTGTDFQLEVWQILRGIPYGQTMCYGEIARIIAARRGLARMSAQAVGGAVGRNKIALIVPCHRVIGADGSLTGYAGGVQRKMKLLQLEHIDCRAAAEPERL